MLLGEYKRPTQNSLLCVVKFQANSSGVTGRKSEKSEGNEGSRKDDVL